MSAYRIWFLFFVFLLGAVGQRPAYADFDRPKTKIDCTKPENKDKPACKPKHGEATDDEIYNAAYWMARQGQYVDSLKILRLAQNPDDPRILNAQGYATRKLGDVEGALPYYLKALDRNPNFTLARAYLGEAYLIKQNLAAAENQLQEISSRCGHTCEEYGHLFEKIALYKVQHPNKG